MKSIMLTFNHVIKYSLLYKNTRLFIYIFSNLYILQNFSTILITIVYAKEVDHVIRKLSKWIKSKQQY